ncbi:alpha/beta hydrolase family protein [Arthrobacter sp. zg-Y40]|uniref:alpha/beta hydrolase n=1 Tax=Arthrobacter sp. zg-Y40 TaxID=2886939 RepID=UPI001D14E7D1|nr:alpha/beta hydrolase family protein [Arthrobacter sp. zg-Y40]
MSIWVLDVDMRLLRDLPPGEPILAAAADLRASAAGFQEAISSIRNKWSALDTLYMGPGRAKVLQAMERPSQQARDHQESVSLAADALNEFAAELVEINAARIALKQQIDDEESRLVPIATEMTSGNIPNWDGAHAMMAQRTATFQADVEALEDRYERARAACQSALDGISRVSTPVISQFDSPGMDLETEAAEDLAASFANATKPDANEEDIAAFYRALGEMGPAQVAAFAAAVPAASLFVKGMGAYQEASFWKSLSPSQRAGLAKSMPGLTGNLEGAPYKVRSEANRDVLEIVLSPAYEATEEQREAYRSISDALKGSGNPPKQLISFEPDHDHPLAAIAVGDLDGEVGIDTNVTYVVPGMNNYSTNMGSLVTNAETVRDRQVRADGTRNHVTVAYIGYETPGATSVTADGHAERGAQAFATSLDGLHLTYSTNGLPAPETNVIAHSYGTHMTTKALGETIYPITSAVYVGSAGVDSDVSSDQLNIDRGVDGRRDIFVSTAKGDGLAPVGILVTDVFALAGGDSGSESNYRTDPSEEDWGGRYFSSEGVKVGDEVYVATEKHDFDQYLAADSNSLRGIVYATIGQGQKLP